MGVTDSCRDMRELQPRVWELATALIAKGRTEGLDIRISETYRTPERQAYLYTQGATTIKTLGAHSFRVAFDIYFPTDGGTIYPPAKMARAGQIGQSIGLEWGGAWTSFRDQPHFQYLGGVSLTQYRSGRRPNWYVDDINDVYATNDAAMKGDEPMPEMTAAEFKEYYDAMLAKNHGDEHDAWAEMATEWAKKTSLIRGDGAGNYEWTEPISRQEMVLLFYRFNRIFIEKHPGSANP